MGVSSPDSQLYKRLVIRLIIIIISILMITLVLPRVIRLLYPFIFALILAKILNPLIGKIHRAVSKFSKNFLTARTPIILFINLIIIIIVSSLLTAFFYGIIREIVSFSIYIQQNWSEIVIKFNDFLDSFEWLAKLFPTNVIETLGGFKDNLLELVQNMLNKLLSSTLSTTATIITGTGTFIINFITFFLAMYFLISDYHIIGDFCNKYISKNLLNTYKILKNSVFSALGGYFKAQIILASFAFVFMLASLGIYGQKHAFIIALFLGIIDFLPFVGTNIVLLPWGIIEFVSGNINKGIFLIIVGTSFFLIRRIIEPKVMGSQTGLHPLLALLITYIGLQLSGLWGAILGPLVLIVIIRIFKSGIFANTIKDFNTASKKLLLILANGKNSGSGS